MGLRHFQFHSLKTRVTLLTLFLFFISIWSLAFFASHMLRDDMQRMLGEQQFSTVSGIAREINDGLSDRRQGLEIIAKEITPAVLGNSAALQALLEQRPLLQLLFNGGVFVTRTDGTAIADVPLSAGRIGTNYLDRESVSIPLKEGKTVIGRPAIGKKLGAPIFSVTAPIVDHNGKVIGALVGTINLGKPNFLEQIAQTRYGKTGDYLLIARKHNLVVTSSDSSRIMKPAPAPGINAMHDRYMQGYQGFGTGVSSRGVLELSAAKSIPVADWVLVATLPTQEAFAPIDAMLQRLMISAFLLTVLAGVLTWWLMSRLLQRQLAPMLSARRVLNTQIATDQPAQALHVERQDEIGELIGDFNRLLANLEQREKALKASESFKDVILNSLDAEIAVVNRSGVIVAVNERWRQFALANNPVPGKSNHITGVGADYLAVSPVAQADDVLNVHKGLDSVLYGGAPSFSLEYPCDSPRQQRWLAMTVMPLGQDGNDGAVITHQEITQRKQAEARLQLAASVFAHAREGIIITDAQGNIVDVNQAFSRITGYSHAEVIGQNPRLLKSDRHNKAFYDAMWSDLTGQGYWSGDIWNRRKDGAMFAELITISAVNDVHGNTQHYVALFSDITAVREHQSQLEHIAHFDSLTNLPNRVLLADRLHLAMAQAQRRGQLLAVAYLDLDGFKSINDLHSHATGDQVLIALTQRMKLMLREGDTLARLGGDEFVAVLIDLESPGASLPLVNRLLAAAAQPMQIEGLELQVTASVGMTFYPQAQDIDADQLLRQADQAMYQAKVAGKNRFHVFDAIQDSTIRGHHESLERLRQALTQGEFVLYYQPKVNMHTGTVIGAEALIRWQHPNKGLLSPAEFLPVIEDDPLAIEVGEWVIDTALTQIEQWRLQGLDLPVSVNSGARQLQHGDFVECLKLILARHPQVDPAHLQIEVLETSAMADMLQVSQVIEDGAQLGVTFALDDFGTGYSSLTYLKRLRVNVLKIDQSFVRDMLEDPDDLAILEGVIGLASAFKRQVIAEGVETVEHGIELLNLGCELAQGYGIARPMPGADMPIWAAAWQPDPAWSRN